MTEKSLSSQQDIETAAQLKSELTDALEALCMVLDRVIACGFQVNYATGPGPLGKQQIAQLTLAKHF